jgi:hypothetical protein
VQREKHRNVLSRGQMAAERGFARCWSGQVSVMQKTHMHFHMGTAGVGLIPISGCGYHLSSYALYG